MKKFLSAALVLSAFAATQAHAQVAYDESRIRQYDQQTQVTGSAGSYLIFTVTGLGTDVVSAPFMCGTINQLKSSRLAWEVVTHSGGQISIRFAVPNVQRAWDGATVAVQRSGCDVDRDRIRIY